VASCPFVVLAWALCPEMDKLPPDIILGSNAPRQNVFRAGQNATLS